MKRACVIGWPVSHSRSPLIHGYWLRRYGIDGSYVRHPVAPGDVADFLRTMRDHGFAGCNVTLPHKEAAFATASATRPAARAAGAANTVWFEGDKLIADNTDGAGFMNSLRASGSGLQLSGATVAVLGAGGAARGIVFALLERGVDQVRIFNRTRNRADAIAADFGSKVEVHEWRDRADRSRAASLLVNTTSLGMKGGEPLDMDVSMLSDDCIVADIVYVPLDTPLLAAARGRGLATVDGLGMLLHQAVPGFEKWFGVRPEVTAELRGLVERDIQGGVMPGDEMLVIGLTGSIGMGKSTVAARLRALGVAVCDADAEVHKLYEGAAVAPIEAAFPGTTAGGKVDRQKLAQALLDKPDRFKRLEAIVHPLVVAAERTFLRAEAARGATMVVLEIPLLLETGGERRVDVVIVCSASMEAQRERVMQRPGMTAAKLEQLLSRQMPDAEKRKRADFVVDTGGSFAETDAQVDKIVESLQGHPGTAYAGFWR